MSRITRCLCYFLSLKLASVLSYYAFPSLDPWLQQVEAQRSLLNLKPGGAWGEWRARAAETRHSLIPQAAASNVHFALDLRLSRWMSLASTRSRWMSWASTPVISLTSTSPAPALQCTVVSSAAFSQFMCLQLFHKFSRPRPHLPVMHPFSSSSSS